MVRDFRHAKTTNAQASPVVRILRVAFYLDEIAFRIGIQKHATAIVASGTRPSAAPRNRQAAFLVPPGVHVRHFDEVADELC